MYLLVIAFITLFSANKAQHLDCVHLFLLLSFSSTQRETTQFVDVYFPT